MKLGRYWPTSTVGSPRDLIPKTCKRPKRCRKNWPETRRAEVRGRGTNNQRPRTECCPTLFPHQLTLSRNSYSGFHSGASRIVFPFALSVAAPAAQSKSGRAGLRLRFATLRLNG